VEDCEEAQASPFVGIYDVVVELAISGVEEKLRRDP
jgi:hypothetical protein